MKVYRNKSSEGKKKLNKKTWISIGISLALVAAALAITLTLTLNNGNDSGNKDPGIETGGTAYYVMPIDSYEVGKTFSDEKLVMYYTSGWYETHEGLDFLAQAGVDVKAINGGTILSVEASTGMEGSVVKIEHSGGVVSVYKGLDDSDLISVGQTVKAGDVIGKVGRMPIEAREYDETHLHLEIYKNGARVNPLDYLPEIGDK